MPNITTVADLIAHLQTYPSNAVLNFYKADYFGYCTDVCLAKMTLHPYETPCLDVVLK